MRMPVIFVGHGSPMIAIEDNDTTRKFKEVGDYVIDKWTAAHEFDSEGLPKEMDLYNNRIGRNIGARYIQRKLSFISDTVYNAVKNGETLMIEGYRLVPTRI